MKTKKIYLDYSATTPMKSEVFEAMRPYLVEHFGNPSSIYETGQEAKAAVSKAREQVAKLINANPKEIFFTGSGTEADNWALNSVFFDASRRTKTQGEKKHIVTSAIEHHAILHTVAHLEKLGCEITYLPPDGKGKISPESLKNAIRENTILVSIMLANNEIGTIEDIKSLAAVAKEKGVLFHTDAVQAAGNIEVDAKDLGVDLLSMSAHKIYGPKGVGALYIRRGVSLSPFIEGGAQESGKRAGTENVAGIVGFGRAAELALAALKEHVEKLTELRNFFLERATSEIADIYVNGDLKDRLPGNANITFRFIEGEALLLLLDMKGIAISTGSACSSASLEPSHVLTAIGVNMEEVHGSARFTFGDFTSKEDVDYAVDALKESVDKLRKISALG